MNRPQPTELSLKHQIEVFVSDAHWSEIACGIQRSLEPAPETGVRP
jgi:hypothetical protein